MEFPLTALLSQALVAFTIECDNTYEHRMQEADRHPWHISLAMWQNFLRYVPPEGMPVDDLPRLTNLAGMQRWGYVAVDADGIVRPHRGGPRAQRVWAPIPIEVEERWQQRLGSLQPLRDGLTVRSAAGLPRALPVVSYSQGLRTPREFPGTPEDDLDLSVLMSRALLLLTLAFERRSRLSLPMVADVMRPLGPDPLPLRDLPARAAISKEAIASAVKFLAARDLLAFEPLPSRGQAVRLTETGVARRARGLELMEAVERAWTTRHGTGLRRILLSLTHGPQLAGGLTPDDDCWRARRPYLTRTRAILADPVAALPWQPAVLHRGGFPDGS